jgi:ribosomal protein S18 acetylase RimI-like enzyme
VTAAITVGSLTSTHRSNVEAILRATAVFSPDEIAVGLELFDTAQSTSDYEFVGAFDDERRLTGFACYGATPSTDGTYDLYWLAVHPDAHGSGAGRALSQEVERLLATRRARLIVVETSSRPDYDSARRFYDRQGYVQVARLRDFYATGDDRIVLTKRLRQATGPAAA